MKYANINFIQSWLKVSETMTASFLPFRPLHNCLPVISSHILHFNAITHSHTHTRSFICTWLAIMANLNFYHVYKQTIRASSSQRKSRDAPRSIAIASTSQPLHVSYCYSVSLLDNICISISYAAIFPTLRQMQIQSILNIFLGTREQQRQR